VVSHCGIDRLLQLKPARPRTKQVALLCHPNSPDLAQLQLRNCAKSGDLNEPGILA